MHREGPNGERARSGKFAERTMKAAFPGWGDCWWGEGGEAAGILSEGRAVPGTDHQQGLEGRSLFGALTFTEPPDADPHVRW
jgi:hypothetical protein